MYCNLKIINQILKFLSECILALKFELSCNRSQIFVVNSYEWAKVLKFVKNSKILQKFCKVMLDIKVIKRHRKVRLIRS